MRNTSNNLEKLINCSRKNNKMRMALNALGTAIIPVLLLKYPPRVRLDSEFKTLSEDELLVSGFDVILRPR